MEQQIQRSIIKKYRKQIWNRFIGALKDYRLINRGDRVAVCISGGKDSFLLACCIKELQLHSSVPFEAEYLVMDPGYKEENLSLIRRNAALTELPVHIFQSPIFEVVSHAEGSPCYLCARMRRGYLYKEAQKLGCNKIALGHHFDDVIETILMSILYGGEFRTMMPKLHSKNFEGMELIRPLYLVKEQDILAWRNYNRLEFLQCACRLTEGTASGTVDSARKDVKELIAQLRRKNPNIDSNIFRSAGNVNLETLIAYHDSSSRRNFLDTYE